MIRFMGHPSRRPPTIESILFGAPRLRAWLKRANRLAARLLVVLVIWTGGFGTAAFADAAKPHVLARLKGCGGAWIAFSRDGGRIITAGKDAARVWDGRTYKPLSDPLKHGAEVLFAGLTADGKRAVTAGGHTARVWDAQTGKGLVTIEHDDFVYSAALSPDGKSLITGGGGDLAWMWDLSTGKKRFALKAPPPRFNADQSPQPVRYVAFSPDGSRVLGLRNRGLYVWDATSGQQITARDLDEGPSSLLGSHERWRRPAAFAPDGKQLISIAHSWLLCVSDVKSGRGLWCIDGRDGEDGGFLGWPDVVAFSPDGRRFAAASLAVGVWDWKDGKADLVLDMVNRPSVSDPRDLVFSPDGRRILVAAEGANSGVYDVETMQQLVALGEEDDVVPAVAYSPDGTRVGCARPTTDETIIVGVP